MNFHIYKEKVDSSVRPSPFSKEELRILQRAAKDLNRISTRLYTTIRENWDGGTDDLQSIFLLSSIEQAAKQAKVALEHHELFKEISLPIKYGFRSISEYLAKVRYKDVFDQIGKSAFVAYLASHTSKET